MVLIAVGHWLVAFGSFNGWKPRFDEKPYVDWKLIFPFGLNYAYVPDRTSNQKKMSKQIIYKSSLTSTLLNSAGAVASRWTFDVRDCGLEVVVRVWRTVLNLSVHQHSAFDNLRAAKWLRISSLWLQLRMLAESANLLWRWKSLCLPCWCPSTCWPARTGNRAALRGASHVYLSVAG